MQIKEVYLDEPSLLHNEGRSVWLEVLVTLQRIGGTAVAILEMTMVPWYVTAMGLCSYLRGTTNAVSLDHSKTERAAAARARAPERTERAQGITPRRGPRDKIPAKQDTSWRTRYAFLQLLNDQPIQPASRLTGRFRSRCKSSVFLVRTRVLPRTEYMIVTFTLSSCNVIGRWRSSWWRRRVKWGVTLREKRD